jgi:hypothetical protein
MKKYLILLLLLIPSLSFAACPGTPADCYTSCGDKCLTVIDASQPAVQAAVNAVTSEDEWWTVVVPEHSGIEWTSGITVANKKIKLAGGGNDTSKRTVITSAVGTGTVMTFNITTYPIELSAFTFNGTAGLIANLNKYQSGNTTKTNGFRIHHCDFNISARIAITGYLYGLVDNCSLNGFYTQVLVSETYPGETGDTIYNWAGKTSWARGVDFNTIGADAVYIENCTYTHGSAAISYFSDSRQGSRIVERYNDVTNATHSMHGIAQAGGMSRGSFLNIYYNNATTFTVGWEHNLIKMLGGTGLGYNNTAVLSGVASATPRIFLYYYRDNPGGLVDGSSVWKSECTAATEYVDGLIDGPTSGYPCGDGLGLKGDVDADGQDHAPYYFWSNLCSGAKCSAVLDTPSQEHATVNVDYYNEPATFDGTVGVGSGLKSAIEAGGAFYQNCTAGVGYWATDEKKLYVCSTGGDAWTLYYTEYACPHPLASLTGYTCTDTAGRGGYISGAPPIYKATSSVVNAAGGTISGSQSVESGSTATFTYEVFNGWKFKAWAGTCGGSGTTTYTTNAISADCTVTAEFEQITLNTFCR